jgi:site-specific recombinase XerD
MMAPPLPVLLDEEAKRYMAVSKAQNTIRAYKSDWHAFSTWCDDRGVSSLPATPETLAVYLAEAARTLKPATLTRRCSSISMAHQMAGHESPTRSFVVRTTLAGIRREKGTAADQKAPILTADLRGMIAALPATMAGTRDRALLLLGFAGALRRSELVGLDVGDVDDRSDGLVVTIVRSKVDQEGSGRKIGIPYGSNPATCPVRAMRAWLDRGQIEEGPLFRPIRHGKVLDSRLSGRSVALIVKRVGGTAGLNPINYAGHSLRAGLVTSAAAAGVEERIIMNQTGHKSLPTLRRYVRDASLFSNNAAAAVGL